MGGHYFLKGKNMSNVSDEGLQKSFCDRVVTRAAELMAEEAKAPVEMILDRMITFATAQAAASFGVEDAKRMLRLALDQLESGALDHLAATKN